ncbi:MAG: MaoC/PaaZ C-terminal domain-containing protein [Pseudomonadota bacterium]
MQSKPYYFDDHVLGERQLGGRYRLSGDEMINYATQWDPQPWHTDRVAAKDSPFAGLTACSSHLFAIYCITSQDWQSGFMPVAMAGLGFDDLRIIRPAYEGDTLACVSVVESLKASLSKPDRGIVSYRSKLVNDADEEVFSIISSVMVKRRRSEQN